MLKKILLCFLCLSLFLSIPCCKKKLPTTPDIPTKILPTIEYFTATQTSTSWTTVLKWKVTNAVKVEIDNGVGEVALEGRKEVYPTEGTTYTLTAKNNDGQAQETCRARYANVWMFSKPKGEPGSGGDYQYYYVTGIVRCGGNADAFNITISVKLYNYASVFLASGECTIETLRLEQQASWSVKINDADGNLRQRMTSKSYITYETTWEE